MYSYIIKSFSEKIKVLLGKTGFMCLLVFTINFILKVLYIADQPLGGDEPFSIYMSQMSVGAIIEQLFSGNNPPLYEIILHYWIKCFGLHVFSVRILSVIASSLTAVFIYKIGKHFFNNQVAIIASFLFLFSNYHIFFSHEARCYSLFSLLTVASFYYFFKIIFHQHFKKDIGYYLLANVMMAYLHYFAVWVLFSQGVIALLLYFIYHKKIRTIVYANVVVMCLLAPLFYILGNKIIGNDTWHYSWLSKVKDIEPLYDMIWAYSNMPINAVACLFFIVLYIILSAVKKVIISKEGLVAMGWFLIIYIGMFLISFKIPMFLNRYVIAAGVAFPLFMGYIINSVSRIAIFKYTVIVLPILFVVTVNFNPKTNIRMDKMAELVKKEKEANTLILLQPRWAILGFSYYYNKSVFQQYDESTIYKNIDIELSKEHIYGTSFISDSVYKTINQYPKIVFITTDHSAGFPENNIQNMLGSKYTLTRHNPDSLGFGYDIYQYYK